MDLRRGEGGGIIMPPTSAVQNRYENMSCYCWLILFVNKAIRQLVNEGTSGMFGISKLTPGLQPCYNKYYHHIQMGIPSHHYPGWKGEILS